MSGHTPGPKQPDADLLALVRAAREAANLLMLAAKVEPFKPLGEGAMGRRLRAALAPYAHLEKP